MQFPDNAEVPVRTSILLAPPSLREQFLLGAFMALLVCLPVLLASYPQMVDYPSHLARYHIMLDGGQSPWLARYYTFQWLWTGNLGADMLIRPIAAVVDIETAGRIVVGIIPVLTAIALLTVEWTLRRRIGIGSLLAIATIWSPALNTGFLNFGLALALALLAFALWVRLDGWRWRAVLFVPISWFVWLCHVSGWGVLGVLAFGYEWSRRRSLAAFLPPLLLASPVFAMLHGGGPSGLLMYGAKIINYKASIWVMALRDQWMLLDVASVACIAIVIGVAAAERKLDPRLGWAALILVFLSLVMPRHFGGGDFADFRLTAVALMIGLLSIDWAVPRGALWLACLPAIIRLTATSTAWEANSREFEKMLLALDHVPQGARIAGAVAVDLDAWALDPFEHAASYATIRRDALVNTHFALPGIHMLQLRQAPEGTDFTDPSQRVLLEPGDPIDLATFEPARHAEYLWYVGPRQPDRLPAGARIVHRTQHSLLARLANPQSRR